MEENSNPREEESDNATSLLHPMDLTACSEAYEDPLAVIERLNIAERGLLKTVSPMMHMPHLHANEEIFPDWRKDFDLIESISYGSDFAQHAHEKQISFIFKRAAFRQYLKTQTNTVATRLGVATWYSLVSALTRMSGWSTLPEYFE